MPTPPSARETSLCGEPPTDPFYLSRKSKSALVPGTYDNSPRGTLTLLPSPPYLRPSQQPHVNQPPPTAHTHCSIARDRTSGTRPFAIHPNFPPARALRPRAIPTPPPPPDPPSRPTAVSHAASVVLPQNIPTFSPRANKQKPQTASLRSRPTPYPAPILPSRCKHTTAAISLPRNPLVTLYLIHYDHHHSTRHPWAQRMQLSLSRRRPRIIAHPNPVHCRPGCPQPPPSRNHHCL